MLPQCFAEVVDHIVQSDFARIELLVFKNGEDPQASQPHPRQSTAGRKRLLYALYERWDHKNINPSDDPLALVDCSARFEHMESVSVTPIAKDFSERFPPDAIERIRAKDLDVLIRFGFPILGGDILTAARYGVWSYHHGDNDYYRGEPAYFWEIYERNPISGAILQILTEQPDPAMVLCKGLFATHPGLSIARNRVQPYWGASTFIIQKLRELYEHGWEHLERNSVKPAPYLGKKKIYSAPSNWEMLRWLAPLAFRKAYRRIVRRPVVNQWHLAIRVGASPIVNSTSAPELDGFRWLQSPKGRFYADPFLIENGGKTWAFFENYDYSKQLATISCAEVRAGDLANPVTALARPYHLSYPNVFRDGDNLYMLPETKSNGTIELYRCVRFPDDWQLERELFKGHAVDTSVWAESGLYWFFVTMVEPRGRATQLWLFSADSLTGAWTSHPANPISTDVRYSRGGGAVFRYQGKLFRPSQDCSEEYGGSFTLNEILVLDKSQYQEKPQVTVNPVWGKDWIGTHTYGRAGEIEIIDGCERLPAGRVLGDPYKA